MDEMFGIKWSGMDSLEDAREIRKIFSLRLWEVGGYTLFDLVRKETVILIGERNAPKIAIVVGGEKAKSLFDNVSGLIRHISSLKKEMGV